MWVTDVEGGLKVYEAVPGSDNILKKINIQATGGLNKFQRPAFGDGRLYVTSEWPPLFPRRGRRSLTRQTTTAN